MKLSMDMIADALGEWVLMKKLCGMGKMNLQLCEILYW